VAAGGADALVLVEDLGRRAEQLFEPVGAKQRRRAPQAEHLAHRLGDFDFALGGHLLLDDGHREQRRQVGRADRLQRARVQHRRHGLGQVGLDVVPELRDLAFLQQVLGRCAHRRAPG
jgi:hypothetical protein